MRSEIMTTLGALALLSLVFALLPLSSAGPVVAVPMERPSADALMATASGTGPLPMLGRGSRNGASIQSPSGALLSAFARPPRRRGPSSGTPARTSRPCPSRRLGLLLGDPRAPSSAFRRS